jgi:hypothetical protein
MAYWIACKSARGDDTVYVNLDRVQFVEPHQKGASIVFCTTTADVLIVAEQPEDIITRQRLG